MSISLIDGDEPTVSLNIPIVGLICNLLYRGGNKMQIRQYANYMYKGHQGGGRGGVGQPELHTCRFHCSHRAVEVLCYSNDLLMALWPVCLPLSHGRQFYSMHRAMAVRRLSIVRALFVDFSLTDPFRMRLPIRVCVTYALHIAVICYHVMPKRILAVKYFGQIAVDSSLIWHWLHLIERITNKQTNKSDEYVNKW